MRNSRICAPGVVVKNVVLLYKMSIFIDISSTRGFSATVAAALYRPPGRVGTPRAGRV